MANAPFCSHVRQPLSKTKNIFKKSKDVLQAYLEQCFPYARSIDSPYKDSKIKHFEIKLTESEVVLDDSDKVKCMFNSKCETQNAIVWHILNLNSGPSI